MACGPPDLTRPTAAGVYACLLGGCEGFPADRELAAVLAAACPGLPVLAAANRAFTLKAAGWAVRLLGVRQVLDLGCGRPVKPYLHQEARAAAPAGDEIRVAYVDNDLAAVCHMATLADAEGWGDLIAVCEGDVSDPGAVLGDKALLEVIDLEQPVAVILGGTLSSMSPDTARAAVAGYAAEMAPGSCAVISCLSYADAGLGARMAAMFGAAGRWVNHGSEDIESFLRAGGLRLVHHKPMNVTCWPACDAGASEPAEAAVLGGISVKDGP